MEDEDDFAGKVKVAVSVTTALIGLFELVVESGVVDSLPNVPFKTMGGKVFWNDLQEYNGWRLQKNMLTRHCRILDPNNIRRAWGVSEEALRAELAKIVPLNSK